MKAEDYNKDVLLDVLGSYRRQILRDNNEYPTVVLSDILGSIDAVLSTNKYNGIYAEDNKDRR